MTTLCHGHSRRDSSCVTTVTGYMVTAYQVVCVGPFSGYPLHKGNRENYLKVHCQEKHREFGNLSNHVNVNA